MRYLNGKTYVSYKMQKKMRNLVYYKTNDFKKSTPPDLKCPRCGDFIWGNESEVDHYGISFREIAGTFVDTYVNDLGKKIEEFYNSMRYVLDDILNVYYIRNQNELNYLESKFREKKDSRIDDVLFWIQFHNASMTLKVMHKKCHQMKSKETQK